MTAFFYKKIPEYQLNEFIAVRDAFDNLSNVINFIEIINTCAHCKLNDYEEDFDLVMFSGEYRRALIKKSDGFFSMAIPFQVLDIGDRISLNLDNFGVEVSGQFISIMRNALETSRKSNFSHEDIVLSLCENFSLELNEAIFYYDAFVSLVSEDHGYFRFDDDLANENGKFHPRYHFDFFCKNSSSIKIGVDKPIDINCFYALFDSNYTKHYLRK